MGLLNIEKSMIRQYSAALPPKSRRWRKDLLIGVTGFFGDLEAWNALDTDWVRPLIRLEETRRADPGLVALVGTRLRPTLGPCWIYGATAAAPKFAACCRYSARANKIP